jgi:flagellar motor switch protein FliG
MNTESSSLAVTQYSGAMKACLWLLSTEEGKAIEVLKYLSPEEILSIRQCALSLKNVPPEHLEAIHKEFVTKLEEKSLALQGSIDYLNKLTNKALGEDQASALFAPQTHLPQDPILQSIDTETIIAILSEEHPQIVTAVLASLGSKKAAEILWNLPESLRNSVAFRLGNFKSIPQNVLLKAQKMLAEKIPQISFKYNMNGARELALILNCLNSEQSSQILAAMPDEKFSQKVKEMMFTFEDITRLDKPSLMNLLKEVPAEKWVVALKASSQNLQDKIFSGMSQKASAVLKEEIELSPPFKISEVESAQAQVTSIALKLKSEGKLSVVDE